MMRLLFICFLFLCLHEAVAQQKPPVLMILDSGRNTSIRGLSVVGNDILWCSGSKGMIARSIDGGKSFEWMTVPGYEEKEFRDIEAFNGDTVLIMGIGSPAVILKTQDRGRSWHKVFEDSREGMFLDAMDFDAKGNGTVIGDPVAGKIFQAFTNDYGNTWTTEQKITAQKGEAFFASSGSNIQIVKNRKQAYLWVSGGLVSRLFYRDKLSALNMGAGTETGGANSIAVYKHNAVIVGGDYKNASDTNGNCLLVRLKQKPHFTKPVDGPKGYRSCVIYYNKKTLICCGTSGVDISYDRGRHWKNISGHGFHVAATARKDHTIFLAGGKGKIACLDLSQEK